ncbi:hypothetical protein AB7M49_006974 [Bradyrhizobium elkanii]
MLQPSDETGLPTPDFARIEIRMTDKAGLKSAADHLRTLADDLDKLAGGALPDPTSNYLAWGTIKSTSKKLRGTA